MSESLQIPNAAKSNRTESWWPRYARRVWLSIRIALVVAAILAIGWWFLFSSAVVVAHTVETGTVTAEVMGTGTLEARTSAVVGPKIGGLIALVAADEGDRVKAGSLLFQLEDSDIVQQVGVADSEVAAVAATLVRLKAVTQGAQAVLAQAMTNHERITALALSNAVSKQDLDKALEALSIAEAESSVAGAAIDEGRRRLDAAKRSLEYQRARLHDTTIEAPFDGLIVRRDRDAGDVVAPATSVFELVSTDEMWISAWVDETELGRLNANASARVLFGSEPNREYPGVVARVGREVDRETRELLVDVRVERLPAKWAVGQRAQVYIRVDRRDGALVLPAGLLLVRDGQTGVMVEENGRARWREIIVGMFGQEVIEVTQGLSVGDVVVYPADSGSGPLLEGRRVKRR